MEIVEQIKEHSVVDYDFMFVSGSKMSITLDVDAGDAIEERKDRYVIETVTKPSFSDPSETLDAETIEVFKGHLAMVAVCKRKQRMPTEEEMFSMQKTLHALAKGVQ